MNKLETKLRGWGLPLTKMCHIQRVYSLYAPLIERVEDDSWLRKDRAITAGIVGAYTQLYDSEEFYKVETEVPFEKALNGFTFTGRIDGVAIQGYKDLELADGAQVLKRFLMEHKTWQIGKRFHSWQGYIDQLIMDDQSTGYLWAMPANGMIYNLLRKSSLRQATWESLEKFTDRILKEYITKPHEYVRRETIYKTQVEIDEWEKEAIQAIEDIKACKNFYKNTNACDNYGGCEYKPLCRVHGDESVKVDLFDIVKKEGEDESKKG